MILSGLRQDWVALLVAHKVLKGSNGQARQAQQLAYNDRQERKDAHDLVYCLEHVPQNLTEVATMFRDNIDGNHRDVLRHSLELLRSRFATVENVEGYLKDGPVAVAKFELGEDDEARALATFVDRITLIVPVAIRMPLGR
jgi:hypothetical protein